MGGSTIQNAANVVSTDFTGTIIGDNLIRCTNECTVTVTGTDVDVDKLTQIKFTIDTNPIYIVYNSYLWDVVSKEKNKTVIKSKIGKRYILSKEVIENINQSLTLKGTTQDIAQGVVTKAYTSSFPLTEIIYYV